jgi:hypothetical protein
VGCGEPARVVACSIQAGIVCFATDREAAAAIIDRLLVTET